MTTFKEFLGESDAHPIIMMIADNYKKAGLPVDLKKVEVQHKKTEDFSQPKMCYNNVFRYMLLASGSDRMRYCLGYVLIHGVPLEHAWLKEDGKYYDLTIEPGASHNNGYWQMIELPFNVANKFVSTHHHPPSLYDCVRYKVY